jgi:hypothetical protein
MGDDPFIYYAQEYVYEGCFTDQAERSLPENLSYDTSVRECGDMAMAGGFRYNAL